MLKVIEDLELLKKLQPYIKGDTEYYYRDISLEWEKKEYDLVSYDDPQYFDWEKDYFDAECDLKTLTTEEAIELLPNYIHMVKWWRWYLRDDTKCSLRMWKKFIWYEHHNMGEYQRLYWNTLLEALGEMLNYLINNNLMKWNN